MMEIDPLHLSEEEINFELALRHITGLGLTTRRNKCIKLRDAMAEDLTLGRTHTTSAHVMDDAKNIEMCQSRIRNLLPSLETAKEKKDIGFLVHTVSRLQHYLNRLSRIQSPPTHLREEWLTLKELISFTLADVLAVLNPSSVNSASEVNKSQVQPTTRATNAISGMSSNSTARADPTNQQTARYTGGSQHGTPRRDGRNGEGTHNSVRRSLIDLLGEAETSETSVTATGRRGNSPLPELVGSPIASSSTSKTRGRGRGITVNVGNGTRCDVVSWGNPQARRD